MCTFSFLSHFVQNMKGCGITCKPPSYQSNVFSFILRVLSSELDGEAWEYVLTPTKIKSLSILPWHSPFASYYSTILFYRSLIRAKRTFPLRATLCTNSTTSSWSKIMELPSISNAGTERSYETLIEMYANNLSSWVESWEYVFN
jgi:hypothetical protein